MGLRTCFVTLNIILSDWLLQVGLEGVRIGSTMFDGGPLPAQR
jgi:hypothetical protein